MRGVGRTRPAGKAKEKVTEDRVSMKAKEEDLAAKENSKRRGRKKEEWDRMAPNMGAGGSHPQAMSDPEEEKVMEEENRGVRRMRWADCEDDEGKEEEEQETEKEGQEQAEGKKEQEQEGEKEAEEEKGQE